MTQLPKEAIKGHNFKLYESNRDYYLFQCLTCKILLFCDKEPYVDFHYPSTVDSVPGLRDIIKKQKFYFYFPYPHEFSWFDVMELNSLSCDEIIIRDIIL